MLAGLQLYDLGREQVVSLFSVSCVHFDRDKLFIQRLELILVVRLLLLGLFKPQSLI